MQNVTYGYTGASFSGRMPCVEIADSIVQTGRETLEKVCLPVYKWSELTPAQQAIKQIETNTAWKADVSHAKDLLGYILTSQSGRLR
jgi:hypothetical protein